jgi:hypothetical protein
MGYGQVIETDEVFAGNERGASNLPANIHSNALSASLIVKSGQGLLYGFTVLNTNASAQFIQVFDAQSVPADGAVPAVVFVVAGAGDKGVNWIPARTFHTGIVICNSSTADTKTLGSADCFFDAQFV